MKKNETKVTSIILDQPNEEREIVLEQPGEYVVVLKSSGTRANIKGTWLVDGKDHVVKVIIHHQAAHTWAETTLKGVAKNGAKVGFWGKIVIDPGCPDVQSFLTERVLLLDENSSAEAVPELEILSDAVKCSHAASVSTLNEKQLFYLKSRGLTHSQAESLIVEGFLE